MRSGLESALETDVAIVGGGPVGLAAAIMLGNLGVRVCLIEQNATTSTHPRGHVVNARTMEILRLAGVESAVRAAGLPGDRNTGVSFVKALSSRDIGVIATKGIPARDAEHEAASPSLKVSCPQDVLEPILLDAARKLATVETYFSTELVDFQSIDGGVTLQCKHGSHQLSILAKYVIGADGSRSRVRERLNIEMEGQGRIGRQIGIYFESDLWELVQRRPYLLFWILNVQTCGVLIALDGRRRWTYNFAFDAEKETVADFTFERCEKIVRTIIGDDRFPIKVKSVMPWRMQARLATQFHKGRVFIAGDAAHPLPPTGGQGMNTGVGDVHNLAWKLNLVLRNIADERLLESYEVERKPVAQINIDQSLANAMKMADSGLSGMASHQSDLAQRLAGPEEADAEDEIRSIIPSLREHFDYLGQTFGHSYESDWIIGDGSPRPTFSVENYTPVTRPGHRLPHLWLNSARGVSSTIDLAGSGKFTLLTTPKGQSWKAAFDAVAAALRLPSQSFLIGDAGDFWDEGRAVQLLKLNESGMVIVRPDGHVLARSDQLSSTPRLIVERALHAALSRPVPNGTTIDSAQTNKEAVA
jgi:putative polyketide hydroxylase